MDHYGQVAGYATAITQHAAVAGTATEWDFWLVGTDLDRVIENERDSSGLRTGFVKSYDNHRLWIIRWGELIDSLRRKYESYRAELDLVPTRSSGLQYLRRTHDEYIPNSIRRSTTQKDSTRSA